MVRKSDTQELPVEFGAVGYGVKTARIGLKIARESLDLIEAEKMFVDRRIDCTLVLKPKNDAKGQSNFIGDKDHCIHGAGDVNRFGVGSDEFTTGLTFQIQNIDVDEFTKFRFGTGVLIVRGVGEIPDDAPQEHRDDAAGSLKFDGDWREFPLSKFLKNNVITKLIDAGLTSFGPLYDFVRTSKKLSEIAGISPGKADYITRRMNDFWADNPEAAEAAAK